MATTALFGTAIASRRRRPSALAKCCRSFNFFTPSVRKQFKKGTLPLLSTSSSSSIEVEARDSRRCESEEC